MPPDSPERRVRAAPDTRLPVSSLRSRPDAYRNEPHGAPPPALPYGPAGRARVGVSASGLRGGRARIRDVTVGAAAYSGRCGWQASLPGVVGRASTGR